ncbi:MAG: NAD-dependent epimerase/dehydratase family protein [Solirubrobacterales bacterium]|nr:NAD-dependent epimerase/dehydratase family protein [Solirubrobacterales bacterium]MBV9473638.1 NAD-dependent epimerase/dehydratase family protein [Solirubrobacterales bacterium]
MPRTLLTGATGFLGSQLSRLLLDRGDQLSVTVRPSSRVDQLHGLDLRRLQADILDRRAIRRAMRGIERVFHVAGTTNLTMPRAQVFALNVEGTRIVLEEALRAGVERVVYTSSVAAVGPAARGAAADEAHVWDAGRYAIPYVDSKHEAEIVALRLLSRGLPLVIVNPAHVLGPGDTGRSSTELVRRFLRRQIPAYVDGTLNVVAVQDVARGHLLADEVGQVGERYILGNRNFTLDRLFADLGRLSGVEPPAVKLPLQVALALATAATRIPGVEMPTPTEIRAASLNWAFVNRKAKRELGWKTSPHEDCLEETIAWYREREGARLAAPGSRQRAALRVLGTALRRGGL